MNKNVVRDFVPPFFLRMITGQFYGWHGNFPSWSAAMKKSKGYDSEEILKKVTASASLVKNGLAVYERDSMLFDHIEYSFPLLSGLLWIAGRNKGRLNVMDFGGSLGSSYFQNKLFLDTLPDVNWCIVEQKEVVKTGIEMFEDKRLHFYYSIDECLKSNDIHVVLLSSVLQYLEEPYKILDNILSHNPGYLIIDRTPFVKGSDRITVQIVNPGIYKGSYPCWFFNEQKFISFLTTKYEMVVEFNALDRANILSEFKGFIFRNVGREQKL